MTSSKRLFSRGATLLVLSLCSGSAAFAQERNGEVAEPHEELREALEGEQEEHERPNHLALILADTYEAEGKVHIFTIGAEFSRELNERFALAGEFEYGPDPEAWVFVAPVVVKLTRELEVFAGPGVEHLSRRSSEGEGIEGKHGESSEEEGADNLFLFRVGAGYHIPLGERFFLLPHVVLDLVDEENGVAKAIVYGVNVGFGF